MKIIIIALLILVAMATADTKNTRIELPDNFHLGVGGYFTGNHQSALRIKDHNGVAVTLELQNLLDMKTSSSSTFIEGYYRFSPAHRVEFGYGQVNSSGEADPGIKNDLIDLTTHVSSDLNIAVTKLLYTYSFFHEPEMEVGISLGLHITKIDFDLKAQSIVEDYSIHITPPLPVLGVRFKYYFSPRWSINYKYDFMFLVSHLDIPNMPNVNSIKGYITDATLGTEYRLFDHFGLGLAVNYNGLDFELSRERIDLGVHNQVLGFLGYATLHF